MSAGLPLDRYRDLVALDDSGPAQTTPLGTSIEDAAATILTLLADDSALARVGLDARAVPAGRAREALRAVLTVRDPGALPGRASRLLDQLLAHERDARPGVDASTLATVEVTVPGTRYPAADRTVLWQGDITTVHADAIVNAANSALLGCFRPFHPCIDNAIHSAAGPRLRDDCAAVIARQGTSEPTGTAKVTRAHHLPARYVLHTVGPIVDGPLTPAHADALTSSYQACLDAAAAIEARTLVFCSISTGVFGYPKAAAAHVALTAIQRWLEHHPGAIDRVVLDVFSDDDLDVYRHALTTWTT